MAARFLAMLFLAAALAANAAAADRRVALIIGNNDYHYPGVPKLINAVNDAQAMDRVLRQLGFETILKTDASRREIYQAVDDFAARLTGGAVGLFYFAGHGVQANGRNYLLPSDAEIDTEADLEAEAVDFGAKVMSALNDAHNGLNIVILDACRDNPLPKKRSMARGLARIDAPRGTFIAYSAGPGETAADGPAGGNGVFTGKLVQTLQEPGLKIEEVFKKVTVAVAGATANKQVPWTEASLQADFYFVPATGIAAPAPAAQSAPGPAATGAAAPSEAIDLAFWDAIKTSNNPADLQAYIDKFPQGNFIILARNRLALVQQPPAAPAASAPAPAALTAPAPDSADEVFRRGEDAVQHKDYAAALRWYHVAADRGSLAAALALGRLHEQGMGVKKSDVEALRWYRLAADHQSAEGELRIARFYEAGRGVKKSLAQAGAWMQKAAAAGNDEAKQWLQSH